MLPGSNLARTLAGSGMDWILVDTEHGNIDGTSPPPLLYTFPPSPTPPAPDSQMHDAVGAIAALHTSPIVRIPASEPWMIKRALDAGAHGIMVPLVSTAAQCRAVVSAAKFPPLGTRGFGSPFAQRAFAGIESGVEYLQQANGALVTVVQIETREALGNIDEIAGVEGVDVLFVGPFDLGNNIGRPVVGPAMHEELAAAIDGVHEAAVRHGKRSGIYCTSGRQAREYADKGFHMISVTGDVLALTNYVAQELDVAKGSLAHSAYEAVKGAAQKVAGPYGK